MVVRALTSLSALALLAGALLLPARTGTGAETEQFKRLSQATPEELQQQLALVPVVGLGNTARAVLAAYAVRIQKEMAQTQMPVPVLDATPLLETRPDLRTLPMRRGDDSQLSRGAAVTLENLSRKLRVYLDTAAPINQQGQRPDLPRVRELLRTELRGQTPEWLRPEAVPTLLQLLMHEEKPARLMLVELLRAIPGRASTTALARRAAFDLDPEVRETAVAGLRERPPAESRGVLLDTLRYPWAPAAEHAAEALANLHDRGAVSQLIAALDLPDPSLPQTDGQGGAYLRELVRVHHLTNCVLCHPPASTGSEPVLGADPTLTLAMTSAALRQAGVRLSGSPGSHSYGPPPPAGAALLRGDITYVRQDFSALQALPPEMAAMRRATGPLSAQTQRFDFVVRKRPVTKTEASILKTQVGDRSAYPQRAAVAFALREITGQDAGVATADWLKLYPDAQVEAEGARLAAALTSAKPERREQLITRYRDEKGLAYTLGLATAIPNFQGQLQQHLREALATRLTRMTAASLRDRLKEDDAELRRAAAAAAGQKGDAGLVPDLIRLLDDDQGAVTAAAATALQELTGKSFATSKEWQTWWSGHKAEGKTK